MTTPLLATRDALVNALVGKTIGAMESVGRLTAEEIADALAGVVRDPATLAADEALVDKVLDALAARQGMVGTPRVAAAYLDALAAVLEEKRP